MKTSLKLSLLLVAFFLSYACSSIKSSSKTKNLLVFSKTAKFRHKAIPNGKIAIMKIAADLKIAVDTIEDASVFTDENLKKYDAVVFLSTTGDILNPEQQAAFERYIKAGGGFVGVHAASDTEYDWPWYGKLVGAYFINHPKIQLASIDVKDANTIATKHLPNPWKHTDEWYNFKDISTAITPLLMLDEKSYTGGKNENNHPIAWYQNYDGGRAFYTGLGHTPESYVDPLFIQHLTGGIKYAMGMEKMK